MGSSAGVVTLLFTDLVGSTELLTRVGDEAAEELRRVHFRLLRAAINTGGGQEVKTLGDGVMAAFSSSLQAVRTAVSIQQAVEEHNCRRPGEPLRVRIGLHAGEPVQAEDDFHGTAVVIAKRLCDTADGGQILVSELVRSLVGTRGGFVFRSAGRLRLKGLAEVVPAVTVEWRTEPRPQSRATKRVPRRRPTTERGPRLVGRQRELSILQDEVRRAASGEFRCVLLVGDPGVGKTRLGAELLARYATDVTGLAARAHALGATTALGVWAEGLERHLRALDAGEIEWLCGGFLDDLARLLRSVAAVRGRGPDHEPPRSRLLEGLAVVFANLAENEPVIIVIDDVHEADPSSLEALHYLARSCADSRLLVVLTARPEGISARSVAGDVALVLEQEGALRRIPVGPLEVDDLRELAESVAGRPVPDALVAWLKDRSRGNPLFASGLVRALVEDGADLSAPALRRLPEALADRVSNRLAHLDASAVSVLEVLAVLGRRAELRSLVAVSDRAPDELAETLEQLVRSRLVSEEERGLELVYEISHPLVQDAIYEGIGTARRRRLHRQLGQALVSVGRLGEAAPHFVRSAEPGDVEAVKVLTDAIRQAEEREAYQESLALLAAMVEVLPAGDRRWTDVVDAMRPEARWVIDHRADIHAVAGIPALRAMDDALRGLDDPNRQARVKFRLASFLGWGTGEIDQAERVSRAALALFEQAGDRRGEILTRHQLALIKGVRGPMEVYWMLLQQVAEDARSLGDETITGRVVRSLAQAGVVSGRYEQGRRAWAEVAEMARDQGDAYGVTTSLGYLAISLSLEGRVGEAERLLAEVKAANPRWRETPLVAWQGWPSFVAGNCPLTIERAREALAAFPGRMSRQFGVQLAFPALAALDAGRVGDAEQFLARSRAVFGAGEFTYFMDLVGLAEAVLAVRQGRSGDGAALFRRSVTGLIDKGLAAILPIVLRVFEGFEQPDLAARAADALDCTFDETGTEIARAHARLGRAWAAAAASDRAAAATLAAEATELLSALDIDGYLAPAYELLGRVRLGHDRAGAVEALERAAALFDAGGAAWRRDTVVDLLRGEGSRGRRAAAATLGPASLTSRERDVARLAAQGHSAREIGERLFIGARTVEGHLARAYAKLGVASKVELARRAAELGLAAPDKST